jgi:hypothetical protein
MNSSGPIPKEIWKFFWEIPAIRPGPSGVGGYFRILPGNQRTTLSTGSVVPLDGTCAFPSAVRGPCWVMVLNATIMILTSLLNYVSKFCVGADLRADLMPLSCVPVSVPNMAFAKDRGGVYCLRLGWGHAPNRSTPGNEVDVGPPRRPTSVRLASAKSHLQIMVPL